MAFSCGEGPSNPKPMTKVFTSTGKPPVVMFRSAVTAPTGSLPGSGGCSSPSVSSIT